MRDYILFDLDGTLTDPAQGICGSVRYALEKGGYPVGPLETYHPWIGPPLLRSFCQFCGVDETEGQRLVDLYRKRFSVTGLFENEVYPGIEGLLQSLKARSARLAVATGKPTVYSERILEHFGLKKYFDLVSGISLTEAPLSKAGVIRAALAHWGDPDLSRCVMVGDREHDILGARECGLDSVMVLYGYGSREEARACAAPQTAETVGELERILLEME